MKSTSSTTWSWKPCQMQCVAVCFGVLQCVVMCCSVLWCVAVCCNVLQCVAMCCSDHKVDSFLDVVMEALSQEVCCSVLQCVAVRCSVLQCVASCCSVLQCVAVCCIMLYMSKVSHAAMAITTRVQFISNSHCKRTKLNIRIYVYT